MSPCKHTQDGTISRPLQQLDTVASSIWFSCRAFSAINMPTVMLFEVWVKKAVNIAPAPKSMGAGQHMFFRGARAPRALGLVRLLAGRSTTPPSPPSSRPGVSCELAPPLGAGPGAPRACRALLRVALCMSVFALWCAVNRMLGTCHCLGSWRAIVWRVGDPGKRYWNAVP